MSAALEELLRSWHGQIVAPPKLNGLIAIRLAQKAAPDVQLFEAAAALDFPALPQSGSQLNALAAPIKNNLVGLLGWTIDALRDWTPTTDPNGARLEGALVAVNYWACCGDFWTVTRHLLNRNLLLPPALELVLKHRSTQFQMSPGTPVWEREHLRALVQAEAAQDWIRLSELTAAFKVRPRLDSSASQALRGLAVLDLPRLTKVVDRATSWANASFFVNSLPLDDALRLAAVSTNNNFRFAAIEAITTSIPYFSPSSIPILTRFLIALAHDRQDWPAWARVLNKYPVRHPQIQNALGRALARSPDSALRSYVEAIELTTPQADGRAQVAECLETFRRHATAARRRILWLAAFERWDSWNFGDDDSASPTSNCELDYAVAGWLIEFADEQFLTSEMSSFGSRLQTLESCWHASGVKLIANYNRLLSRYRMVAFADYRRSTAGNWLLGAETFLPPVAESEYLKARFSIS
jgi:hypothetical protein